jgi:hypothetical protein
MATTYELTPTIGLVGGMTVQFADGRWPGEIGHGVAMTDEAFNIVEPHLMAAAPEWTAAHRYGAFELRPAVRLALVAAFRNELSDLRRRSSQHLQADFLEALARWLEARLDEAWPVSVLGY